MRINWYAVTGQLDRRRLHMQRGWRGGRGLCTRGGPDTQWLWSFEGWRARQGQTGGWAVPNDFKSLAGL